MQARKASARSSQRRLGRRCSGQAMLAGGRPDGRRPCRRLYTVSRIERRLARVDLSRHRHRVWPRLPRFWSWVWLAVAWQLLPNVSARYRPGVRAWQRAPAASWSCAWLSSATARSCTACASASRTARPDRAPHAAPAERRLRGALRAARARRRLARVAPHAQTPAEGVVRIPLAREYALLQIGLRSRVRDFCHPGAARARRWPRAHALALRAARHQRRAQGPGAACSRATCCGSARARTTTSCSTTPPSAATHCEIVRDEQGLPAARPRLDQRHLARRRRDPRRLPAAGRSDHRRRVELKVRTYRRAHRAAAERARPLRRCWSAPIPRCARSSGCSSASRRPTRRC